MPEVFVASRINLKEQEKRCAAGLAESRLADRVSKGRVLHLANPESVHPRDAKNARFVHLLTQHKERLFRYIYCLVRSLQDTEDVFQQTAVTLWDKFEEFDPNTNFVTWACTVARFKSLRFLESKGRQRLVFSEDLLSELVENDACLPDLHDARLNALAKCRERLSENDQLLLLACYGGERSIRDAAAKVGRPVGSVYDSLSRIRRALYSCIERTLINEGYPS